MIPPNFVWTKERVDLLIKLHAQGVSAAEISRRFMSAVSRSAVIGKIHRLGLAKSGRMFTDGLTRSTIIGKRTSLKKERARKAAERPPRPALHLVATPLPEQTVPASVIKFEDLEAGQCRYPFGTPGSDSFGFCGAAAVMGGSYCLEHHRICFAPPVPQRPRRVLEVVPTFADAEKEAAQ